MTRQLTAIALIVVGAGIISYLYNYKFAKDEPVKATT